MDSMTSLIRDASGPPVSASLSDDPVETSSPSLPNDINLDKVIRVEILDEADNIKHTKFLFITDEDEVFYGQAPAGEASLRLENYKTVLRRLPDSEIFPEIPEDVDITVAPEGLPGPVYCKRPGLHSFEPGEDRQTPRVVLEEAIIMETLAKHPHPNIIQYFGCRTHRGRITGLVIQRHPQTLDQFALTPEFDSLNQEEFIAAITSAVDHIHELGLTHNDINPYNILVDANSTPILIDFGSCGPFGVQPLSLGTSGWEDSTPDEFWTSEAKHDIYALGKLAEWFQEKRVERKVG